MFSEAEVGLDDFGIVCQLRGRPFHRHLAQLQYVGVIGNLQRSARVLLAGHGADEARAERAGAELLSGDPVGAADRLAAAAT